MSTKGYLGFFILFRSWVNYKNVEKPGLCVRVKTRSFFIFANNSRSKQNLKSPGHYFEDIGKKETCAKPQHKIFNSMVVGARHTCQFFRQNTWFLENKRVFSNFLYRILIFHYLIGRCYQIIVKSVHETQFCINRASHL